MVLIEKVKSYNWYFNRNEFLWCSMMVSIVFSAKLNCYYINRDGLTKKVPKQYNLNEINMTSVTSQRERG